MANMDPAVENMVKNLEAKSGKKIDDWIAAAKKIGGKHGEVVAGLKKQGLGHGYANMVAHLAGGVLSESAPQGDALVDAMFKGEKAALRPWYDMLIAKIKGFGGDVEIAPKKTYTSLRRSKQFALIQPSTKTRLDVGLNLKGEKPKGKLEDSGSFNAMCSHRVRVESESDINAALLGWLRQAYEKA